MTKLSEEDIGEAIVFRIRRCDGKAHDTLSTGPDTHFTIEGGVMLYASGGLDLRERMLALPHGDQARCHLPRFALNLTMRNREFRMAALCWECNNISVSENGNFSWLAFDAHSTAAVQLLADINAMLINV